MYWKIVSQIYDINYLNDGSDLDPGLSPHGSTTVFISNREEECGIYTMDLIGASFSKTGGETNGSFF